MGPIIVTTDLATLVAFDPAVLKHRVRGKGDWWRVEAITELDEVASGAVAILPVGGEGTYRVALREGALAADEQPRARGSIEGLGVHVPSGQLFVGAAERLPGDGRDRPSDVPGTGAIVELAPGRYALTVHALEWRDDRAFFDEDNEPLPTAPADFVLVVTPATDAPDVPFTIPALLDLLPKREAKASTHIPGNVIKRRSAPEPTRRPRGASSSERVEREGPRARPLTAIQPVPDERAPLSAERVTAAFREVMAERWLHPPAVLDASAILMRPKDTKLLSHEVKVDDLLGKITRVREQMRVLEAKVNADEKLPIEDIVDIETRVTGVYEALDALVALIARPR
jgi:hypothetical protein